MHRPRAVAAWSVAVTAAVALGLIAADHPRQAAETGPQPDATGSPGPAGHGDPGDEECLTAPLKTSALAKRKAEAHEALRDQRRSNNSRSSGPRLAENLREFVRDRSAAIALGKALFWDVRLGSDDRTACATCHFRAGADARTRNVLYSFERLPDLGPAPEFPERDRQLADITREHQPEIAETGRTFPRERRWSVGSEGIMLRRFDGLNADGTERSAPLTPEHRAALQRPLNLFGEDLRQVTARNAPTVINAAFLDRQFLDGRAAYLFNGYDPFGEHGDDSLNTLGRYRVFGGKPVLLPYLRIEGASLASQALGPIQNEFEMASIGRTMVDVARKLLDRRALELQRVAPDDSALAAYADRDGPGLRPTYRELIRQAFDPEWWDTPVKVAVRIQDPTLEPGYRVIPDVPVIEANFSLFFGLAIMLYESTLISDDAPFDRFTRGDASAIVTRDPRTPQDPRNAWRGFEKFRTFGCIDCHGSPTFAGGTSEEVRGDFREIEPETEDSPDEIPDPQGLELVEWMKRNPFVRNNRTEPYDNGYYNIGLLGENTAPDEPRYDDFGVAGGVRLFVPDSPRRENILPLVQSYTKEKSPTGKDAVQQGPYALPNAKLQAHARPAPGADGQGREPGPLKFSFSISKRRFGAKAVADASFRTQTLRNIELTAPYMHNGAYRTLEGVLEFYARGGDFDETVNPHLNPAMRELGANQGTREGMSPADRADIIAFLRTLTDPRVAKEQAPFDHPELPFPRPEQPTIPAVGRDGRAPMKAATADGPAPGVAIASEVSR
ncbi:cytochrome-c peroxidase [Tundrisphaera sp. TA3]|uniref:cytochrome-c peroxidase n=1 Tax=Tundrisphaera sp. TA3 TaxID=3435775 RepID=UPI003EBF5CB8